MTPISVNFTSHKYSAIELPLTRVEFTFRAAMEVHFSRSHGDDPFPLLTLLSAGGRQSFTKESKPTAVAAAALERRDTSNSDLYGPFAGVNFPTSCLSPLHCSPLFSSSLLPSRGRAATLPEARAHPTAITLPRSEKGGGWPPSLSWRGALAPPLVLYTSPLHPNRGEFVLMHAHAIVVRKREGREERERENQEVKEGRKEGKVGSGPNRTDGPHQLALGYRFSIPL